VKPTCSKVRGWTTSCQVTQGKQLKLFRHIPKKVYSDFVGVEKEKPRYEVPGYAGYVTGIKPENLHAKTFGKLTYDVSNTDYLKGQDHPVENRYVSTLAETHIPPSLMLQRTAADIVGVPPKKIDVNEVWKKVNSASQRGYEAERSRN
jgi:hypothetical protein